MIVSNLANMKLWALTGLNGLKTIWERLAGGANSKLSGAKDADDSPRPRVTCFRSVRLLLVRLVVFVCLELAVTAGAGAAPLALVDRLAGATGRESRLAYIYIATKNRSEEVVDT